MRISGLSALCGATRVKFALAGFATILLSGCSDSIERFASGYGNPSDSDPVYTASIPKPRKPAVKYQAPSYEPQVVQNSNEQVIVQNPITKAPVASAPAVDYTSQYRRTYRQPKLVAETPTAVTPEAPKYAFNKAQPTFKSPAYKAPVIDAQADAADEQPVATKTVVAAKPASGATVTVAQGMTLYGIAKTNHLTVQQLAAANGIAAPYTVAPGRVLKVPGAKSAQVPAVAEAKAAEPKLAVATKLAETAPSKGGGSEHIVAQGETLFSLGRTYSVSPFAIADLNRLPHDKPLTLGQKLKIPAGAAAAKQPEKATGEDVAQAEPTTNPSGKAAPLALPKEIPPAKQSADTAQTNAPAAAAPALAVADPQLAMRWPLKGKVISAFGPKPNGMKNEGINIAVPEGTKIQAAEAGVVAYAGNELKGYGNLILIRHSGGYVTAYAHASNLLVKKGDQVKRGDVIATAGQTGAVQSPQLHFEVRKGATALDPTKFLTANTASN